MNAFQPLSVGITVLMLLCPKQYFDGQKVSESLMVLTTVFSHSFCLSVSLLYYTYEMLRQRNNRLLPTTLLSKFLQAKRLSSNRTIGSSSWMLQMVMSAVVAHQPRTSSALIN